MSDALNLSRHKLMALQRIAEGRGRTYWLQGKEIAHHSKDTERNLFRLGLLDSKGSQRKGAGYKINDAGRDALAKIAQEGKP